MELLPESLAEQKKAGEGRDDPNANPALPPPDRIAWGSLIFAPHRLLYEILGPELCCRMMIIVFIAAAILGLFNTFPLILTNVYTSAQIAAKLN